MTREAQIDKLIDDVKKVIAKIDMPLDDYLTLYAKFQDAIYKCAEISQEQRMGHWLDKSVPELSSFECDQCKRKSIFRTHYCGHCGAKME